MEYYLHDSSRARLGLTIDTQTYTELCPTCGQQYPANTGICPQDGEPLLRQMPDPMIGTMLPRHYRITESLGRGAMSVVYKGVYEPLKQPVAIKLLKSHLVSDLQTFKRFQQEAKTAGALEHPHIVAIFDFGVTDQGVPYLVMELLQGESLSDRLKRQKKLPIATALRLFIQTADALEYTHQRGVIHRDVKPSNLLVYQDSQGLESVKIVDFGIAKLQNYEGNPAANLTQTGEVFGTPLYVSPEQAMGRPLDWRADIYSLGCVMYEAIAGRPAFNGPTAFDVIRLQISQPPPPLESLRTDRDLPPSLVTAINKAMSKDPGFRFQSMEELLIELQRAELEYSIAQESLDDGKPGHSRSNLTPIDGVKILFKQGEAGVPAINPSEPGHAAAKAVPQRTSFAGLPAARSQARHLPVLPFVVSSFSGCALGCLILLATHQLSAPPFRAQSPMLPAGPQQANRNDTSQQAQPGEPVLDAQAARLREEALRQYDLHNFKQAEKGLDQALNVVSKQHDPLGQALMLSDLCMIEIEAGNLKAAYTSGSRAVELLDGRPDAPPKYLSFALRGLGTTCYYLKDLKRSQELLERSVSLDRSIYGESDENLAVGIARLAKVYEDDKQYDKAEKLYKEALSISQRCHQPGDPHLAARYECLSAFLKARHRLDEARALERQSRKVN